MFKSSKIFIFTAIEKILKYIKYKNLVLVIHKYEHKLLKYQTNINRSV